MSKDLKRRWSVRECLGAAAAVVAAAVYTGVTVAFLVALDPSGTVLAAVAAVLAGVAAAVTAPR